MTCGDCQKCGVEQPPDDREYRADGIFVKQLYIAKAGTYIPQHSHESSHLTMLAAGKMRAWKDDVLLGDFVAPAPIFIEAKVKHTFLSLTDETIAYCIHAVGESGDVRIADEHQFVRAA